MDRRTDFAIAVCMLLFGIGLSVASVFHPPTRVASDSVGPYGFALVIGIGVLLGAGVLVVRTSMSWRAGAASEPVGAGVEDEPDQPASAVQAGALMLATIVYVFLLTPLGYVLASLAFIVVALRVMRESSWRLILVSAVAYTALTFVLFAVLLRVPMPLGPLNDLFIAMGLVDKVR